MNCSVVIPCYNEVKTIETVIGRVRGAACPISQIIIVDDCSTDGTRELLKQRMAGHGIEIYYHEQNQGKGAALQTGFRHATGDIILIQDADLEYDPVHYARLIDPIVRHSADVVYGSRFKGSDANRIVYFWHYLGNAFLTLLSNMFTNLNLSDMETGYKAFRRSALEGIEIEEKRFGFEPEITAKLARKRCVFYEIGISYYGRTYDQGKKIGWRDGVRAIYAIVKYNLFAS